MTGGNPYTFKSDVYSYGIVLFEMTTNALPYTSVGNRDMILFQVGRGILTPDLSLMRKDTPRKLKQLLISCIHKDCDKRPGFVYICEELEVVLSMVPRIKRCRSEGQLLNFSNEQLIKYQSSFKNSNNHFNFSPEPHRSFFEF